MSRHLTLVYSAALRIARNPTLAEEASQNVFSHLASLRKALPASLPLNVWLHRTVRSTTLNILRAEDRRRRREHHFAILQAMSARDPFPWEEIAPVLDEVMERLPTGDRSLILSRFFEGRSHSEIAGEFHLSEDAVRMRIKRALERMRGLLVKKGIQATASALAAGLPAHASTPVTPTLAASIASTALPSTAPALLPPAAGFITAMTSKTVAIAAGALLLTGGGALLLHTGVSSRIPGMGSGAMAAPHSNSWIGKRNDSLFDGLQLPADQGQRSAALKAFGNTVSLDKFLAKWESARNKLTAKDQTDLLSTVMPRLFWCRSGLGIERLSALLGDISPESLPEIPLNRGVLWYQQLFAAGPPEKKQTRTAREMTLKVFCQYGHLHAGSAIAWLRDHWQAGGGGMLREILNSQYSVSADLLLPFLKEKDLDFTNLSKFAYFPESGKSDCNESALKAICGIEDPVMQEDFLKAFLKFAPLRIRDAAARNEIWAGIERLPEGPARRAGEEKFAEMLALNAPMQALEWLAQQPKDAELTDRILSHVLKKGFPSSELIPRFVEFTLAEQTRESRARSVGITQSLVENAWKAEVPINYVNALPEGEQKRAAEGVLAALLPARNPVAASRWLNSLPASAWFRDQAAEGLALTLRKTDPEVASAWASSVRDPQKRSLLILKITHP